MPKAVITGATKGIGKAIADLLISNGFDIAICARNKEDLELQREVYLNAYPQQKIFIKSVDVSDESAVKSFADEIITTFGNVDVLVNNAGIFHPGNVLDEAEGQLMHTLQTNLLSAYHLTRKLVPFMIGQPRAHIFNMASIAGLQAYPGGGSYSISKYALLGFSDNLRFELKDRGIKVTAICPGAVWSNSWSGSGIDPNRIMKAEDIAATLWSAYQLSEQAVMERIVLRPQLGDL